jgi:hypothetical protein
MMGGWPPYSVPDQACEKDSRATEGNRDLVLPGDALKQVQAGGGPFPARFVLVEYF